MWKRGKRAKRKRRKKKRKYRATNALPLSERHTQQERNICAATPGRTLRAAGPAEVAIHTKAVDRQHWGRGQPYPSLAYPLPSSLPGARSSQRTSLCSERKGDGGSCRVQERERQRASLQFSSRLCSWQSCLISFFVLRRCSYSCCCTQVGFWFVCVFSFFSFCRVKLVYYGLARHGIFIFSRSFRARAGHDAAADGSVFVGFVREDGASSALRSAAEDLAGGSGHGAASRLRRGNAGWHRRKGKAEIIWDSYLTFNASKVVTSRTNDARVLLD